MKIKSVSILADSPKIYRDIINELRKRGLTVLENGDIKIQVKGTEDRLNVLKYVGYIILLSRGKQEFNELLIGIDTNSSHPVVVVLADGELIEYKRVYDLQSLIELLGEILVIYPAKRKIIGVGTGNSYGKKIYQILASRYENVREVDEKATNSKSQFNKLKDEDLRAAYNIALRASS